MSGIPRVTARGERTYKVAELVIGGQVVEGRTGGAGVGVAAAGSAKWIGVAAGDAMPPPAGAGTSTIGATGLATLVAVAMPEHVTVYSAGSEVPVVFAAVAAFGDKLVCASLGRVTPAGATPDARTLIGTCVQPGGVTVVGATGLMRVL